VVGPLKFYSPSTNGLVVHTTFNCIFNCAYFRKYAHTRIRSYLLMENLILDVVYIIVLPSTAYLVRISLKSVHLLMYTAQVE